MTTLEILKRLDEAGLQKDHLPNTRKAYRGAIADYLFLVKEGKVKDFQSWLDYIAAKRKAGASAVKLALNAGVFFNREVLKREPPVLSVPKARKSRRVPVWLTHAECLAIFARLEQLPRLQCALMYACGLRISELLHLRLKDIDLEAGLLTIRGGKGDKDRTVLIATALVEGLDNQISRCIRQWKKDNAAGLIFPPHRPSLRKKLGAATFTRLPWYWLFPSRICRGQERWHATDRGVATPLRLAAQDAGIIKRVSPHVFRHSYATNLHQSGVDIRTIQLQLGHAKLETTEIYTHAIGAKATPTPLDRLGAPENILSFKKSADLPSLSSIAH